MLAWVTTVDSSGEHPVEMFTTIYCTCRITCIKQSCLQRVRYISAIIALQS